MDILEEFSVAQKKERISARPFGALQRLRWLSIAGQALTLYAASGWLGLQLRVQPLICVFCIAAFSNLLLPLMAKASQEHEKVIGLILIADVFLLTFMLYFSGGPSNPFSILYLLHVVVCAVLMKEIWTWALASQTIICFGVLFLLNFPVDSHHAHAHGDGQLSTHLLGMWLAYSLVAVITAYCITRISSELRNTIQETAMLKLNQQRLASLTTLAAGAAHELGTPLNTLTIVLDEIQRREALLRPASENSEDLTLMREQLERCKGIIFKMRGCSGEVSGEMLSRIRLSEFLSDLRRSLRESFGELVHVETPPNDEALQIPKKAITQAVIALAKNAIEASDEKRPISVGAEMLRDKIGFFVNDRGSGMAPDILARAGEPFFTTKQVGRGMGLGVFLARLTTESLGGTFSLESALGEGTRAKMIFPRMGHHGLH